MAARAEQPQSESAPHQASLSNLTPDNIIATLNLNPHPESGHSRITFRDESTTPSGHPASIMTYHLFRSSEISPLHRIDVCEAFHHYAGGPLDVVELTESGPIVTKLGPSLLRGERPQYVVPAGRWFGLQPAEGTEWVLVGFAIAPARELKDVEWGEKQRLLEEFGTTCQEWIEKLVRRTQVS